jgi:hypothetical protein
VEKLELSCIVGGNIECCSALEKCPPVPPKVKFRLPFDPKLLLSDV